MTQPDLFSARKVTPTTDQVARMIEALRGHGWKMRHWFKGREGWNDRELRAVAAASDGRIISGQRGYCLLDDATVEEANHFISWMRSQAAQMNKRAAETQRALNGRFERRIA